MWRITRLYLKNITYIQSGMHKDEVELELSRANQNSKLNIFIGPIGSGKSVILGHLQPFASFGTLDVRNSNSMVLPDVNGLKIIEYDHDNSHYVIRHDYIWNKTMKTHNVKSFIEKDGMELNSNGNSSSFKEIIKIEFGIDQNFLRLLRLGPNVANVIRMKSTERKKFIASLREDAEIYLMIHKKLSEDYRTVNASITSVSNRLMQLSATKEEEMRTELDELQDNRQTLDREITKITSGIDNRKGMIQALCNGDSIDKVEKSVTKLHRSIQETHDSYDSIMEELDVLSYVNKTPEEISNTTAQLQGEVNALENQRIQLERELEEIENAIVKLTDSILVHQNDTQLSEMKKQLEEAGERYTEYSQKLSGFKCKYNYQFLSGFIDNLFILNNMIDDLAQYNSEVLHRIYQKLNVSMGSWITERVNRLTGRKVNLQKSVNNIRFADNYVEPFPLFRAPFCPTDTCPYYTTHPITTQEKLGSAKDIDAQLARIQDEVNEIDRKIAEYQEYPVIQNKLQFLSTQWKNAISVLIELRVVDKNVTLIDLLTNLNKRRNWYSYNQLIDILEKCKMKMEFDQIAERYSAIKRELTILESPEYQSSQYRLDSLKQKRASLIQNLNGVLSTIRSKRDEMNAYGLLYVDVLKKADLKKSLALITEDKERLEKDYDEKRQLLLQIEAYLTEIKQMEISLMEYRTDYQNILNREYRLKVNISEIEHNQTEYQSLIEQRRITKAILEAVSAKEGIPLILVKAFLNQCKGIVNDLIQDVFEDELDILDFDLNENEFKIPFSVNGQVVDDIEYASQGQQSIISIALSFALVRQSMFDYNIMLLDEIDGPLHKNDREKFIGILFKQMAAISADQVFLITHNSTFEGNPINVIMTADEQIENTNRQVVIKL